MTKLIDTALTEIQKLSDQEQDAIASIILDELLDQGRWKDSFSHSQDALARLADKAQADRRAGRVRRAGFDEIVSLV
jgi:hypothetical protein